MTGFSIGSIHTWNLISNEKYKNFFAAAAPTNAMCTIEEYRGDATDPTAMGTGTIMPIIYFGGTGSHIREMPNQPWFMMEITDPIPTISYILARNDVTDSYKNDESAGFWGIKADSEEEFTSKYYNNENNKLVKDVVSSYKSKDGNVYTQFVAVSSTHEYEDINTELAWNFMSQFSRNEDGSININK